MPARFSNAAVRARHMRALGPPRARALALLLFATLALPGIPLHAASDLPEMGSSSATALSAAQEKQIGASAMRSLRASLQLVDDPVIESYVEGLGYRLAEQAGERTHDFTFFVVDDPSINAFAMPGGYIGVHVGLILATQSEHELAAVLAHEMAHVTQRHIARQVERQNRMGLPGAAAILAALVLSQYSPQAAQAALSTYAAGSMQLAINHTRAHEYEADRVGIDTLARSGFDAHAMPAFFERLQRQARLHGAQAPEILSTHPVGASRIADARHRAGESPDRAQDEPRAESTAFYLTQARVKVVTSREPRAAAAEFQRELEADRHPRPASLRYGRALALIAAQNPGAALAQAEQLLEAAPDRFEYQLLMAEAEDAAGHPRRARARYRELAELYPDNASLTRAYAQALLDADRAGAAQRVLREHLRYNDADASLYQLLGGAHAAQGEQAAAHEAMAEHYYLTGNLNGAIEQLELALRDTGLGAHERARAEARRRAMQSEAAEKNN